MRVVVVQDVLCKKKRGRVSLCQPGRRGAAIELPRSGLAFLQPAGSCMDVLRLAQTFQVAGRAAIESHNASSPLQQRKQRAPEQRDAGPNTPARRAIRSVTKQFSPRE